MGEKKPRRSGAVSLIAALLVTNQFTFCVIGPATPALFFASPE
jgi:hypothetical protein